MLKVEARLRTDVKCPNCKNVIMENGEVDRWNMLLNINEEGKREVICDESDCRRKIEVTLTGVSRFHKYE